MADKLTPEQRSRNMSRIPSKDTFPEMVVRKLCREIGLSGYRLHKSSLPGHPDIAWLGKKLAVFVNGCFWHGHNCANNRRRPKSNKAFWEKKFTRNRQKDAVSIKALRAMGWNVCIIWECELKNMQHVKEKLLRFVCRGQRDV